MKIINVEQGTPEWFAARLGKPSASRFGEILTSTGKESKSREKYLYELAGEIISGQTDAGFCSAYMKRGNELEDDARRFLMFYEDVEVHKVGFCLDDNELWGSSPDGLIYADQEDLDSLVSGCEIKCKNLMLHVECLKKDAVPVKHMPQIQGAMMVTNTNYWYFMSYFPGVRPFIKKVFRDQKYINDLIPQLVSFDQELKALVSLIRGGNMNDKISVATAPQA